MFIQKEPVKPTSKKTPNGGRRKDKIIFINVMMYPSFSSLNKKSLLKTHLKRNVVFCSDFK